MIAFTKEKINLLNYSCQQDFKVVLHHLNTCMFDNKPRFLLHLITG